MQAASAHFDAPNLGWQVIEDGDLHALSRLLEQKLSATKRHRTSSRPETTETQAPRLQLRAPLFNLLPWIEDEDRENEMLHVMHKALRQSAHLQPGIPVLRANGELRSAGVLAQVPMSRRRNARIIARSREARTHGRAAALTRREDRRMRMVETS